MLKVVGLLLLSVCGCEYLADRDTGPFECPSPENRFEPELDTADGWGDGTPDWRCEWVDGVGTDFDSNHHCLFMCEPNMCADGYVGYFCVGIDHLDSWAHSVGGDRAYGFFEGRYTGGSLKKCYATCTPGYEEPK